MPQSAPESSQRPSHRPSDPLIITEDVLSWPRPTSSDADYRGSGKLQSKVALITGGDTDVGRAIAILFAKEGADVAIVYGHDHHHAWETRDRVEAEGRLCLCISGDVGDERLCRAAVGETVRQLDGLDILVNNACEMPIGEAIEDISPEQLERTFRAGIFSCFFMTRAALPHLGRGASIINTTSLVTSHRGQSLLDYAVIHGAVVAFTSSLSATLAGRGIRVNGVAPCVSRTNGREARAAELAPSFVFLASGDSSHTTGQVLQPTAGEVDD